jgi:hypothetical protein
VHRSQKFPVGEHTAHGPHGPHRERLYDDRPREVRDRGRQFAGVLDPLRVLARPGLDGRLDHERVLEIVGRGQEVGCAGELAGERHAQPGRRGRSWQRHLVHESCPREVQRDQHRVAGRQDDGARGGGHVFLDRLAIAGRAHGWDTQDSGTAARRARCRSSSGHGDDRGVAGFVERAHRGDRRAAVAVVVVAHEH